MMEGRGALAKVKEKRRRGGDEGESDEAWIPNMPQCNMLQYEDAHDDGDMHKDTKHNANTW